MSDLTKQREDILMLTGSKEWETVVKVLGGEFSNATDLLIEAESWDKHNYCKGYRDAIRYVANMRENLLAVMEAEASNADL